jgi:hypothetical protein
MFQEEKIPKVKRLSSGEDTTSLTRDGESSMLTEQRKHQPRELIETSVSISTDFSILDQDSQ